MEFSLKWNKETVSNVQLTIDEIDAFDFQLNFD